MAVWIATSARLLPVASRTSHGALRCDACLKGSRFLAVTGSRFFQLFMKPGLPSSFCQGCRLALYKMQERREWG